MAKKSDTDEQVDATRAAATEGHDPNAGLPVGPTEDITEAAGGSADGPVIEHRAPMFWMRSLATGNIYPAFDLGTRDELANTGCEVLPAGEGPDGYPAATGMAGTGLLA